MKSGKIASCILVLIIALNSHLLYAQNFSLINKTKPVLQFGDNILPDTVAWLNSRDEKYFIGNGIAGGGGNTAGEWDFLIGPDYTSPNFIYSETIFLKVDGELQPVQFGFHRIRATGIFYGSAVVKNALIQVMDFAVPGNPLLIRKFVITNTSQQPLALQILAQVKPGQSIKTKFFKLSGALLLTADKTAPLFGNGDGGNWKIRYAQIAFTGQQTISEKDSIITLQSGKIQILPSQFKTISLCHQLNDVQTSYGKMPVFDEQYVSSKLSSALLYWEKWLREGSQLACDNQRVIDIIESSLIGIKMQQNRDGGFIAGVRKYAFSYIRDSHGACRGLLSCGHSAEAKKYLQTTYRKFKVLKQIPNSVQMGADLSMHGNGNQFAESPAYILLLARDYYKVTRDLKFLVQINELLKYAMDIQVSHAKGANWLLPFNGDETEKYCVREDGQEYGGSPQALTDFNPDDWSMASLAACISSIDFYSKYLKLSGKDNEIEIYVKSKQLLLQSVSDNFFNKQAGYIDWAVKKDKIFYPYTVVNFELLPLWFGASMQNDIEKKLTKAMLKFINPATGFIPNAPGNIEGFCGHSLGYLLYNLSIMKSPERRHVFNTLISSNIIQKFGMVNEYYGPSGVPNMHNLRCFESGIVLDAIVAYLKGENLINK